MTASKQQIITAGEILTFVEQHRTEFPHTEATNILLIGRTGQGKSSIGNLIFGEDCFAASDIAKSVTKNPEKNEKEILPGHKFVVVDTPGFADTENPEAIADEMANAIVLCKEGYHAIAIVIRYPLRLTEEHRLILKRMETIFGPEFFNVSFLIVTHGRTFLENRGNRDIVAYLKGTQKDEIRSLLGKINSRAILAECGTTNQQTERDLFITDLCNMLAQIKAANDNKPYDNEIFQEARRLEALRKANIFRRIKRIILEKLNITKCIII